MTKYHFSPKTKKAEKCGAEIKCDYQGTEHIENPTKKDLEGFERRGLEASGETLSNFGSVSKKAEADPDKIAKLQKKLHSQQRLVIGISEKLENDEGELGDAQRESLEEMLENEKANLRKVNDQIADEYNGTTADVDASASASKPAEGLGEAGVYSEPSVAAGPRTSREGSFNAWGKTPDLRVGSNTPWGKADHVEKPAPGITVVGTPSHGGVKLSAERNRGIHEALRNKDGWYEEDTDSQIVGYYYPEAFPHYVKSQGGEENARAEFESSVKNWNPDGYEKATGKEVTPEESYTRREGVKAAEEKRFRERHKNEFVSIGNSPTTVGKKDGKYAWVPNGYELLSTKKDSTGEERTYLVPRHEALTNGTVGSGWNKRVVVDPERHVDVSAVLAAGDSVYNDASDRPRAKVRYGDDVRIDTSSLTASQSEKAEEGFNKQYRWSNGDGTTTTETKAEHLQRLGVKGKSSYHDGTKEVYHANIASMDSRVVVLKNKAEFLALDVEDVTTDDERISSNYSKAQASVERARSKQNEYFANSSMEDRKKNAEALARADKKFQAAKKDLDEKNERSREKYKARQIEAAKRSEQEWVQSGNQAGFRRAQHRNHVGYKSVINDVENWANSDKFKNSAPTESEVSSLLKRRIDKNELFDDMNDQDKEHFINKTERDILSKINTRQELGKKVDN